MLVTTGVSSALPSSFAVNPTEAFPGDDVQMSGNCTNDANNWVSVWFYLDNPGGGFTNLGHFDITPDVPWEFTVTIPASATPGSTTVGKQCARLAGDAFAGGEATQRADFVVLDPASTSTTSTTSTTTTTAPTSTTSTTSPASVGDAGAAASPVAAAPAFTG